MGFAPVNQRPGRCEEQALPGPTGLLLEKDVSDRRLSDDMDYWAECNSHTEATSVRSSEARSVMLEKEPLENGHVRITFRISHYIWADSVTLVGEFNGWNAHSHPLRRTRNDGEWHISLVLERNRTYRFRYLVNDEEWMDDDHADGYKPNPFGGFDSVVCT